MEILIETGSRNARRDILQWLRSIWCYHPLFLLRRPRWCQNHKKGTQHQMNCPQCPNTILWIGRFGPRLHTVYPSVWRTLWSEDGRWFPGRSLCWPWNPCGRNLWIWLFPTWVQLSSTSYPCKLWRSDCHLCWWLGSKWHPDDSLLHLWLLLFQHSIRGSRR